jgi:hypothetical protein
MQQTKHKNVIMKPTLLFAVSGLLLLGAVVALGITRSGDIHRTAGLMPEVVSTADIPRLVMHEIVVRAPHPGHLADAVARLSAIN